jgi:hypothetical protein
VLAWCRKKTGVAQSSRERDTTADVGPQPRPSAPSSFEPADGAHRLCGVAFLFRSMAMLQIDSDELARDDPLLFRELQGLCSLCGCKEQCAQDLARTFDDVSLEKWREYCPNAATLMMLGAVQNCGLAAQYLKKPRATGVLEVP